MDPVVFILHFFFLLSPHLASQSLAGPLLPFQNVFFTSPPGWCWPVLFDLTLLGVKFGILSILCLRSKTGLADSVDPCGDPCGGRADLRVEERDQVCQVSHSSAPLNTRMRMGRGR